MPQATWPGHSCFRSLEPQQDMVGKHADSRTTAQKRVSVHREPNRARKSAGPLLDVAGRHRDSDSRDPGEAKLRSKHAPHEPDRRILDTDASSLAEPSVHTAAVKTTESLAAFPLEEIPRNLPETNRAHQTQQRLRPWFEKRGQINRQSANVLDAVESAKIGKSAIEGPFASHFRNLLRRNQAQVARPLGALFYRPGHPVFSDTQHARETVTSHNAHAVTCQEASIHSGAAADLEDSLSRTEAFRKLPP